MFALIKKNIIKKTIYPLGLCFVLFVNIFSVQAAEFAVPAPDQLLTKSDQFSFPLMKGVRFDPQNPLNLTFVFDGANKKNISKTEATKLVNYFLAGLTIPEEDLWVNLSPYESERVVPNALGNTDLGKDMLMQDYVLKQFSSSLTFPESELGKKYWFQLNVGAGLAPTQNNDAFNKIWIVPNKAEIYEEGTSAFVVNASLKALTETDYYANQQNNQNQSSSDIVRDLLIPEINYEINSGRNFANLRQIYHSVLLGMWFKKKFVNSFYKDYFNTSKVNGIDIADIDAKNKIFNLYVEAFKKGVFNYSRKERDQNSGRLVKRHYFSGGLEIGNSSIVTMLENKPTDYNFIDSKAQEITFAIMGGGISGNVANSSVVADTETSQDLVLSNNELLKRAVPYKTNQAIDERLLELLRINPESISSKSSNTINVNISEDFDIAYGLALGALYNNVFIDSNIAKAIILLLEYYDRNFDKTNFTIMAEECGLDLVYLSDDEKSALRQEAIGKINSFFLYQLENGVVKNLRLTDDFSKTDEYLARLLDVVMAYTAKKIVFFDMDNPLNSQVMDYLIDVLFVHSDRSMLTLLAMQLAKLPGSEMYLNRILSLGRFSGEEKVNLVERSLANSIDIDKDYVIQASNILHSIKKENSEARIERLAKVITSSSMIGISAMPLSRQMTDENVGGVALDGAIENIKPYERRIDSVGFSSDKFNGFSIFDMSEISTVSLDDLD